MLHGGRWSLGSAASAQCLRGTEQTLAALTDLWRDWCQLHVEKIAAVPLPRGALCSTTPKSAKSTDVSPLMQCSAVCITFCATANAVLRSGPGGAQDWQWQGRTQLLPCL